MTFSPDPIRIDNPDYFIVDLCQKPLDPDGWQLVGCTSKMMS
jgi:hypothetical protein